MGEPPRRATYDDIVALPANVVGEIIAGRLVTHPRPASPHALAATALGSDLHGTFQRGKGGPGGWVILFEPELHLHGLHGDILVPDIAGWRRERMPRIPEAAAFELAPDWVCEVLSTSTVRVDRGEKLGIYAREGVGHAWLVDPIAQTLEVLRREGDKWLLVTTVVADARVRIEPFEAIELELGALWAR